MRTTTRLQLAYGALAVADTVLAGSSRAWAHGARRVTKPLLMPVLAASLATDPRAAGSPLRTSTLAGEVAGWGGDVLLLGEGTGRFAAGAGSFGVGHLAYLHGLHRLRERRTPAKESPAVRAIAGVWAATAPVVAIAAARQERALGPTVLAYSGLLATMTAAATRLGNDVPRRARVRTATGAGLFLLSDSLLGARTFLLRAPAPWVESAVMATYTAGQYLISRGAALG